MAGEVSWLENHRGSMIPFYLRHKRAFKTASTVVHLLGAIHFIMAALLDLLVTNVPYDVNPVYSAWSGQFKFLTYWNVCLQAAYMTYALGIDVYALANKNARNETTNKLVKIKDNVEASIAFPIAVFVSVTFWGLMAVDRELVLPSKVDPYFPSWLNHMEHTNIIIFQLLEVTTSPREYPSKRFGLITLGLFQTSYIAWMHLVYYKSGVWVYPIFKQLTPPLRILFLAGSVASGLLFYFAGSCLNWLLWGGDSEKVDFKPVASQAPNQSPQ